MQKTGKLELTWVGKYDEVAVEPRILIEDYAEPQEAINQMIATLGWDESAYMYRFFPGQSHSENDWRSRLDIPIRFILN